MKQKRLREYLSTLRGGVLIAYSGGVDSTYLLKMALDCCKGPVVPVFFNSPFIAKSEQARAISVSRHLAVPLVTYSWDPSSENQIMLNSGQRCYFCKLAIYRRLKTFLGSGRLRHILDGTQADDLNKDRPGLKAIRELNVHTPLADCGLTKEEIRQHSKELGLPTWNIASQSCLATRISTGVPITKEMLAQVESLEIFLKKNSIWPFRVRFHVDRVYLEVIERKKMVLEIKQREIQGLLKHKSIKISFNDLSFL